MLFFFSLSYKHTIFKLHISSFQYRIVGNQSKLWWFRWLKIEPCTLTHPKWKFSHTILQQNLTDCWNWFSRLEHMTWLSWVTIWFLKFPRYGLHNFKIFWYWKEKMRNIPCSVLLRVLYAVNFLYCLQPDLYASS